MQSLRPAEVDRPRPAFAEKALGTIETISRRAVADLDHMLGLLREERPRSARPRPRRTWATSAGLIAAAQSAGLTVELTVSGDLSQLPALVS